MYLNVALFLSSATKAVDLTLTRVVFEFSDCIPLITNLIDLTLTRVVFECS